MLKAQTTNNSTIVDELFARFGADTFVLQPCADDTPTLWVKSSELLAVLAFHGMSVTRSFGNPLHYCH